MLFHIGGEVEILEEEVVAFFQISWYVVQRNSSKMADRNAMVTRPSRCLAHKQIREEENASWFLIQTIAQGKSMLLGIASAKEQRLKIGYIVLTISPRRLFSCRTCSLTNHSHPFHILCKSLGVSSPGIHQACNILLAPLISS